MADRHDPRPPAHPTVVILTALPLEYEAVRAHLDITGALEHESGTIVEHGRLHDAADSSWNVVVAEMGEGTENAAAFTRHVIDWLHPEAVFFVGVAGGLKDDIGIGDVVVATKIYAVQGGKQTPDGLLVRPDTWHPAYRLDQAARFALRGTGAHFKPVAVGAVLLADAASAFAQHINRNYNDAVAYEMESTGIAHAAHQADVGVLIIRGISDKANADKGAADAFGSQPRAAAKAALAALAVVRKLQPRPAKAPATPGGDGVTIGTGGTFEDEVIGKDVGPGPQAAPQGPGDHVEIGRNGTFQGPVIGKRVGYSDH